MATSALKVARGAIATRCVATVRAFDNTPVGGRGLPSVLSPAESVEAARARWRVAFAAAANRRPNRRDRIASWTSRQPNVTTLVAIITTRQAVRNRYAVEPGDIEEDWNIMPPIRMRVEVMRNTDSNVL